MAQAIELERPERMPINVLFVTQNIGTIECKGDEVSAQNQELTQLWMKSISNFIAKESERVGGPMDLVFIHLQELGGKKYNKAFLEFLRKVIGGCYPSAGWCSGLLNPDENDGITFTAMGTVIFASSRIAPVCSLLSFKHRTFVSLEDGPLDFVQGNQRALYFGAKFSDAGTSRKGFLLTSVRVGATIINAINTHLFHDADNAVAIQKSPSTYAASRAKAMCEAMNEISSVVDPRDPLFVFGDLNMRLDLGQLKSLLEEQFQDTITVETKKVAMAPPLWEFLQKSENWAKVRSFDVDAKLIMDTVRSGSGFDLQEYPVEFGPTYLVREEPDVARGYVGNAAVDNGTEGIRDRDVALSATYKHERFPAWCDRVFFNSAGRAFSEADPKKAYWTANCYPMDHIPVYLRFQGNVVV